LIVKALNNADVFYEQLKKFNNFLFKKSNQPECFHERSAKIVVIFFNGLTQKRDVFVAYKASLDLIWA
jgi:hypothetical protein